jgi:hypothetical protein
MASCVAAGSGSAADHYSSDESSASSAEFTQEEYSEVRERWGVLHGLQRALDRNGVLVRIGEPRYDGRIKTEARDGDKIAVRAENLRELMSSFNGVSAGDVIEKDQCEIELFGFDPVERCWVGEIDIKSDVGAVKTMYPRIADELLRAEFRFVHHHS